MEDEGVSRNASELDSASKHCLQVVKLPELLKPETGGEEGAVLRRGVNERHPLGLPGWLEAARAERVVKEPGRPAPVGGTQTRQGKT